MLAWVFGVLDTIDGWLSPWLVAGGRLLIFGAVSGMVSMLLYKVISSQRRLRSLKEKARIVRRQLAAAGDDLGEVMRLTAINLKVSFSILGIVIVPAVLSSLPSLVVTLWAYANFHYAAPSERAIVRASSGADGQPVEFLLPDQSWADSVAWPGSELPVSIRVGGTTIFNGELGRRGYLGLHERSWIDSVDGLNTAFLMHGSPVEEISFTLPRQAIWPGVDGWIGHWEWTFFAAMLLGSVGLKFALRIE
jgi:hypothetical protein